MKARFYVYAHTTHTYVYNIKGEVIGFASLCTVCFKFAESRKGERQREASLRALWFTGLHILYPKRRFLGLINYEAVGDFGS